MDRSLLIAGFIASKIVNKQGEGIILDIILGIVGAIVGVVLVHKVRHGWSDGIQSLQHACRNRRRNHSVGRSTTPFLAAPAPDCKEFPAFTAGNSVNCR